MIFKHISVLPKEVIDNFKELSEGSLIVDGTLGKGGHSNLLLEKGFRVIGIDRDKDAIEEAERNLKKFNVNDLDGRKRLQIVHGNFSNICGILKELGVKKVDGILLDLGVSTYQLENISRGFGFEGKLDMRMDIEQELSAREVVNEYSEDELSRVLYKFGEMVYAKQIAKEIVEFRSGFEDKKGKVIETGEQLLKIIKQSMPEAYRNSRKHHWASPTFRALRIEVNNDFKVIEDFLDVFTGCLKKDGILEIITFHTMEEKIVRKKLRMLKQKKKIKLITKKSIGACRGEIIKNPKSKRAQLWIAKMR